MKIVLASSNQGKIAEFQHMLDGLNIQILPQSHYQITDVEETGLTFIENAIIKARHAAHLSGLPALADDSGLVIDALNGAPGIYSARYAGQHGDFAANIQQVLHELKDVPESKRTARFVCVLTLLHSHNDPLPLIVQATWEGRILLEKSGVKGFGYDPIFWVPTHNTSAAELATEVKNQISHRAQALRSLLDKLKN